VTHDCTAMQVSSLPFPMPVLEIGCACVAELHNA
jgi:hypothetical protein